MRWEIEEVKIKGKKEKKDKKGKEKERKKEKRKTNLCSIFESMYIFHWNSFILIVIIGIEMYGAESKNYGGVPMTFNSIASDVVTSGSNKAFRSFDS